MQVYLALSELIANGGNLERARADAEAAVDALSSEAAKTVKALKKSLTIGKKANKVDMSGVSAGGLGALAGGRCACEGSASGFCGIAIERRRGKCGPGLGSGSIGLNSNIQGAAQLAARGTPAICVGVQDLIPFTSGLRWRSMR